jgi:5-methylcytosine-specific restriction endonuclease McrA
MNDLETFLKKPLVFSVDCPYTRNYKKKKIKIKRLKSSWKQGITSKEWKNRRKLYWETHVKKCEKCGRTSFITLHHLNYEKPFGEELDSDLLPLCWECHKKVHAVPNFY